MGKKTMPMVDTATRAHLNALKDMNRKKRQLAEAQGRLPTQMKRKEDQRLEKGWNSATRDHHPGARINEASLKRTPGPRKKWGMDGSIHIKGDGGEDHRLLPKWARTSDSPRQCVILSAHLDEVLADDGTDH